MKMKWVPAEIVWLSFDDGGRRVPPSGEEPPIYWAVIRFADCDKVSNVSWSVNVRKIEAFERGYKWNAMIAFRVPEAPEAKLFPGARFELLEGPRCVAKGVVNMDY